MLLMNLTPAPVRLIAADGSTRLLLPSPYRTPRIVPRHVMGTAFGGIPAVTARYADVVDLPAEDGNTVWLVDPAVALVAAGLGRWDVASVDPDSAIIEGGKVWGYTRLLSWDGSPEVTLDRVAAHVRAAFWSAAKSKGGVQ